MDKFWKKNGNQLLGLFLLFGPILDLLTGLGLHYFNKSITLGIIIRLLFLAVVILLGLFVYKKKKLIFPYLIIGLYGAFYLLGVCFYKEGAALIGELQSFIKAFYFPIVFITLYSMKDEIRISKFTLFSTLFLYIILIFAPTALGTGYKTYQITKAGTLGYYNSANEISGIISLLTPIMFLIFTSSKKIIWKILFLLLYLFVILTIGTKTPLITFVLTIGCSLGFLWMKWIHEKTYKKIGISLGIVLFGLIALTLIIPKTNFYKNIETHLHFLKLDNVTEVFEKEELIDHFIFSQRLTFLHDKALKYKESNLYQKLFGIGYYRNGKRMKLIEMDYFDIYYSHGLIGFLLYFGIVFYLIFKVLERKQDYSYEQIMLKECLLLIIGLSLFTGHIMTAPSVSLIVIILLLSLKKRIKKDILFTGKNLQVGGIESAQVNLLNLMNDEKYNITLLLEEKKGDLLKRVKPSINIKECKVSNHKNIFIRKTINAYRKLIFKILNNQNFDFSCCYTTYSYSANKLAKIASVNTAFYVHSDYHFIYPKKEDFHQFFDSRKVWEYSHIIFVSNEARESFLKEYKELEKKTIVINNFINPKEIIKKGKEKIKTKKSKNKTLFVFVGRLDDSSKKLTRAIHLVNKLESAELWIVGDGPDRKMYEEEAKGQDNVIFFGKQENPYSYMSHADYIILTSDYEGFPVIYLEAIALRKKIITTIPTKDDFIDMKEYAFIVSKDEKEMVKEVKKILKEKKEPIEINLEEIQEERLLRIDHLIKGD